ncbi:MAG: hypothetical protein ABFR90_03255 [Planctomycetota bacterium]
MKNKRIKDALSAVAVLMLLLTAADAAYAGFSLSGTYTVKKNGQMDFNGEPPGQTYIDSADPGMDDVLNVGSYVTFKQVKLDWDLSVQGEWYDFKNDLYVDGFKVYNAGGDLLMQADMVMNTLTVGGGTGHLNTEYNLSLTDIEIFAVGSPALDLFRDAPDATIMFQMNVPDAFENMTDGSRYDYAVMVSAVPELATLGILGLGSVVLFNGRKKKPRPI